MPMDAVTVAKAVALIDDGRSQRYVSRILRIPRSTLKDAVRRFRETGSYTRRPGQGRRRCTSARDDRFIVSTVLRNRFTNAVEVRNLLHEVRLRDVSERTIRRRLREQQLIARRPARCPQLLPMHRVSRLRFAQNHSVWNIEQWRQVLFTDESRICLRVPDGRERVYRRAGERFAACNIKQTLSFNGGSVMVWGGICYDARTELVIIDRGSITGDRYLEDIILEHVIPFAPYIGDGFILMHDNARPHVARCVTDYLNTVGIERMEWPAQSPDLNPIEHVWDKLKRRVKTRLPAPQSLAELRDAIREEWDLIPQNDIQNLINRLQRRLNEVIRARGGNTRY